MGNGVDDGMGGGFSDQPYDLGGDFATRLREDSTDASLFESGDARNEWVAEHCRDVVHGSGEAITIGTGEAETGARTQGQIVADVCHRLGLSDDGTGVSDVPSAERPDWHAAARELVNGFAELDTPDERIELMDRLCHRLGGSLYPAFLQILCAVERAGDEEVRALVNDTLIHALGSGRLPAGRMPAWGASAPRDDSPFDTARSLGPIEYLCAWYAQTSELPPLGRAAFDDMATRLLRLVSENASARAMYCAKLMSDAEDPLSGSLSFETRAALGALAETWQRTDDVEAVLDACREGLRSAGEERLGRIETNPFF